MSGGRKYRLLVVDDEASVLMTYRLILERHGYEVVACATSREALDTLATQTFDGILCDLSLEDHHTGFEVIGAARERDSRVPAALLTGYVTREAADEATRRQIGIMLKPIEISEFLEKTSRMMRGSDGKTAHH